MTQPREALHVPVFSEAVRHAWAMSLLVRLLHVLSCQPVMSPLPKAPFEGWSIQVYDPTFGFAWYTEPGAFLTQLTVRHGTARLAERAEHATEAPQLRDPRRAQRPEKRKNKNFFSRSSLAALGLWVLNFPR